MRFKYQTNYCITFSYSWKQNVGFRKVIDILVNSRKQIVGHNMLIDLILMYQQFQGPLPSSSELFKSKLSQLFPSYVTLNITILDWMNTDLLISVTDTKLMAIKSPKLQTTNLEELYNYICRSPFDMPFIGIYSRFININK